MEKKKKKKLLATIFLLSAVLDLLARLNCFLHRKNADFSRLSVLCELENLIKDGAEMLN